QARSGRVADIAATVEGLKYEARVGLRDANARIAHSKNRKVSAGLDSKFHNASHGRIFDRVVEKVGEDMAQQPLIRLGFGEVRCGFELNNATAVGRGDHFLSQ